MVLDHWEETNKDGLKNVFRVFKRAVGRCARKNNDQKAASRNVCECDVISGDYISYPSIAVLHYEFGGQCRIACTDGSTQHHHIT